MRAEAVHVRARLRSTAPFPTDIDVGLDLGRGNAVHLSGGGEIAGELVTVSLVSDGRRTLRRLAKRGAPVRETEGPTPRALRESLVLGFTRMGLLHNVVRLAGFELPDRALGGAADWVQLRGLVARVPERVRLGGHIPVEAMVDPIDFVVIVSGRRAATATLWLLEDTPYRREQRVFFDEGHMDVHEQYGEVEIDTALPADRFVLPRAGASTDGGVTP